MFFLFFLKKKYKKNITATRYSWENRLNQDPELLLEMLHFNWPHDIETMHEKEMEYVLQCYENNEVPTKKKLKIGEKLSLAFASTHRMDKLWKSWIEKHPEHGYKATEDAILFNKDTFKDMLKCWLTDRAFKNVNKANVFSDWFTNSLQSCLKEFKHYKELQQQIPLTSSRPLARS